jgi:hypothetical protein
MASGAAHPITNTRGTVTCPTSGDLGYEANGQSCTMRPVVGDSGDSTKGCPKVFTYKETEFLGYAAHLLLINSNAIVYITFSGSLPHLLT